MRFRLIAAALLAALLVSPAYAQVELRVTGAPAANDCVKFVNPRTFTTAGAPCATGGAPTSADYLVGTANGSLSAEIVVPATGIAWLVTSGSSANLAAHVTDETGTGPAVFRVQPQLGAAASSALTGFASGAAVYIASTGNSIIASESTTTSGPTSGAFFNLLSNDGAAMASGDKLGRIAFGGAVSASALQTGAALDAYATETWSGTAKGSRACLLTTPNATTTLTERLCAEQDGTIKAGANTVPVLEAAQTFTADQAFSGGHGAISASGSPSSTTGTIVNVTGTSSGTAATTSYGTTRTWNNASGTHYGYFADITNTASGASSRLINLQVGSDNKFDVDVSGNVVAEGTVTSADEAYTSAGWDGDLALASRNAVRDKIETMCFALDKDGTQRSLTGSTTETTLDTVTIPAGTLGANGVVEIIALWTLTNNANNKTPIIRFGGVSGTQYLAPVLTTTATFRSHVTIQNRNATNSQIGMNPATGTAFGTTTLAPQTSAVDTTAAVDIVFRGLLANAADSIALESMLVRVCP